LNYPLFLFLFKKTGFNLAHTNKQIIKVLDTRQKTISIIFSISEQSN